MHAISEGSDHCANAQADLSLRWSHKSYRRFCRALALFFFFFFFFFERHDITKSTLMQTERRRRTDVNLY